MTPGGGRPADTDQDLRPRRSVLYVPASNARAVEKARSLPADGIILDLEDAVAPEMKELAREQAAKALRAGGYGRREMVVRINGLDTPWGEADLAAVASLAPEAVLVPKISDAAAVIEVGTRLAASGAPEGTRVWAMIETPRAVLALKDIAGAAMLPGSRLACLVLGTNDLLKETGARAVPGRGPLLTALAMAVYAARASGLAVLDGVYNDFNDPAGLAAECVQARDFGFDGKTLIHPSQIATANAAFAPSASEIAEAEAIVAAFEQPENAGKGAIALGGRMVERLHLAGARRTLALHRAIDRD